MTNRIVTAPECGGRGLVWLHDVDISNDVWSVELDGLEPVAVVVYLQDATGQHFENSLHEAAKHRLKPTRGSLRFAVRGHTLAEFIDYLDGRPTG